MSTYKDKELVVKRDGTVLYDGNEIGRVYADPADTRVQQRDWCYSHVSGTTLKDLHPDWEWPPHGRPGPGAAGVVPAFRG